MTYTTPDMRKVSPKTVSPKNNAERNGDGDQTNGEVDPGWAAPESWAVQKGHRREDNADSNVEEGIAVVGAKQPNTNRSVKDGDNTTQRQPLRRGHKPLIPLVHDDKIYRIRIHRANDSYHVAPIPLQSTVAELTPLLDQKLLLKEGLETHRLYLKERGRGMLFLDG